jgi:hypothetical protein
MSDKQNFDSPRRAGVWENLETVGDVKRFFRWCILSVRDGSLDTKKGSCLGQLGLYLLKTIEAGDFEKRLDDVERRLEERHVGDLGHSTSTH